MVRILFVAKQFLPKKSGGRELGGEVADFPLFLPVKTTSCWFLLEGFTNFREAHVLGAPPPKKTPAAVPFFGKPSRLGGYDGTGVGPILERGGFSRSKKPGR